MSTGEFIDYDELSDRQRIEAHLLRPRWAREDFHRFAFWVCPDGQLSRRGGHHQLTKVEQAKTQAALNEMFTDGAKPEKGGIRHLRTNTFALNREPV